MSKLSLSIVGVFSGLTLGLLSLDSNHLDVIIEGGKLQDQARARKIKPLVKRHHLLLVTLLVSLHQNMTDAFPITSDTAFECGCL